MTPEFHSEDSSGYGAGLRCPLCKGEHIHHGRVDVFERCEDADAGTHVGVLGGEVRVSTMLAGNPSARRNGLTVAFTCENCHGSSVLSLAQHKGVTYLDFK